MSEPRQWFDPFEIDGKEFVERLDELFLESVDRLRSDSLAELVEHVTCKGCGTRTDVFGNCLGSCAGEEWE